MNAPFRNLVFLILLLPLHLQAIEIKAFVIQKKEGLYIAKAKESRFSGYQVELNENKFPLKEGKRIYVKIDGDVKNKVIIVKQITPEIYRPLKNKRDN